MNPLPFLLHWHTEPLLLIALLGSGWAYGVLVGPARSWIAPQERFPMRAAIIFYSALVLSYLAVASPLDQLGEGFLFCAHMIQHLILMFFIAPMLIVGVPPWLWDWLFAPALIGRVARILLHPVTAWASFTLMMNLWHWPIFYESALVSKPIHILEHATMLMAALQMWWPLIGRSRAVCALPYGPRMVYIVLLMIGQFPVFGSLTLSEEPLYLTYAYAPRIINVSALQDQVIGGLTMNILGMFVYLWMFGRSFYEWYAAENQ